jgi:hypothetical protein
MSIGSEVADLAILLCIICVPLAVGAVFIPIGRALAERIRSDQARRDDLDGVVRALHSVDVRLDALARTTESNASALEQLAARRLPELSRHAVVDEARRSTPH